MGGRERRCEECVAANPLPAGVFVLLVRLNSKGRPAGFKVSHCCDICVDRLRGEGRRIDEYRRRASGVNMGSLLTELACLSCEGEALPTKYGLRKYGRKDSMRKLVSRAEDYGWLAVTNGEPLRITREGWAMLDRAGFVRAAA